MNKPEHHDKFKKGVGHFIVFSKSRHKETLDIKGHDGELLHYPATWNDAHNSYKEAEIVAAPEGFEETVGGYLIFNFRVTNSLANNDQEIYPGYFKVPFNEKDPGASMCYGYVNEGKFVPFRGHVFLQEVYEEVNKTSSGLILVENIDDHFYASGEQKPKKEAGKVVFANKQDMIEHDFEIGDEIYYRPQIGVEQEIEGAKFIRIMADHIVSKKVEMA